MADVQPYVLRYWETEFPALAPNKSCSGQLMYSRAEIDVILRIKQLLYSEGFTIAGAKKKLESDAAEPPPAAPAPVAATAANVAATSPDAKKTLKKVRRELNAILRMLED